MENASKALIIAGAILLSILLITMGIAVYQQAAGVLDTSALDGVAVTTFNNKFTQYEGNNVSGTNVNALLSSIRQNNVTNSNDTSKQVQVTVGASNWSGTIPSESIITTTTESGQALTGKAYNIVCEMDAQSGYVTLITITDAG